MTLLYRRCLHFLNTIQKNHSLFYFSVPQKHPRSRLAILIYNLEMWRSNCNMKTAAWNYDDLWLGSAFSNGVFNATQMRRTLLRKPHTLQGPFVPGVQIYFWVPTLNRARYRPCRWSVAWTGDCPRAGAAETIFVSCHGVVDFFYYSWGEHAIGYEGGAHAH